MYIYIYIYIYLLIYLYIYIYITKYARAQVNTCVLVPPPGQLHPRQIPAAVTNARLPASKPAESSSQQASANSHPKMAHSRAPGAQWWSCGFPQKQKVTPKHALAQFGRSQVLRPLPGASEGPPASPLPPGTPSASGRAKSPKRRVPKT